MANDFKARAADIKRKVEQDPREFYARYCGDYGKRTGHNFSFKCPLHADDTPSLTVYPDGHFHCFGCGEHGDAIDFVAKLQGCSLNEALDALAAGGGEVAGQQKRVTRGTEGPHAEPASPAEHPAPGVGAIPGPDAGYTSACGPSGQRAAQTEKAAEDCGEPGGAPIAERAMAMRRDYPAIDADGNVIGVHVRTDKIDGKKTFSWRWADATGKARRSVNDLPLYGLPRLMAAQEQGEGNLFIIITEGEKCADALNEAGLLALGLWGAGHSPKEEALAPLRDKRVVLWPDNDQPGVNCMKKLGKKLLPVAKEVRVVVWPGAPEKADAYDYLAWHGAEGLAELRGADLRVGRLVPKPTPAGGDDNKGAAEPTAPVWDKPADAGGEPALTTVPYARWTLMQGAVTGYTTAVTLDRVVAQTTWLWENWIPNGYVTILAAEPGTGKSGLALWLVHSYLDGRPWPDEGVGRQRVGRLVPKPTSLGPEDTAPVWDKPADAEDGDDAEPMPREPATRKVLWLETDDCHGALRDRIATWDVRASAIVMLGDDGLEHVDLSLSSNVERVRNLAAALDCGMIVVDTLAGAHPKDENSAAMRSLMSDLASLARDLDVPIICCHHLRKKSPLEGAEATMDRLRGSSAIAAGARSIIGLDKLRGLSAKLDDGMEKARMRVIKANLCLPPQPLCYWIEQDGLHFERIDEELDGGLLESPGTTTTLTEQAMARSVEMFDDNGEVENGQWKKLLCEWGFKPRMLQHLKERMPLSVRKEGPNTIYSLDEGGGGASSALA